MRSAAIGILLWLCAAHAGAVETSKAETSLPTWTLPDARQDRYLAVHGLRAFAGGYSEDGLEFWTFPLQIVSDYRLQFVTPEGVVDGLTRMEQVEVDPVSVTRHYRSAGYRVRERIFTHARLPGIKVSYEIEGDADVQLRAQFRPSLNLMWPVGAGGQEMAWDAELKGLRFSEPRHVFEALVSSAQASDHTEPSNDRRGSRFDRIVFLQMKPERCGRRRCASLIFAGQSEATETTAGTTRALRAVEHPAPSDRARYTAADRMELITPDADANRALRWAQIALEQAWTCNARLGCGLVAGYGSSHGSRRPQYAWYFAGDGLVGTRALIHEGRFERAAEELDFILRYQHPDNGMIWHEMSQSAAFVDWAHDYHYMYVHVDIAFSFLGAVEEYVRASGDGAFLRAHWPAILKAYRYCVSTLDRTDHLPRVPADKMSANEQDRLTDELTLSAAWVEASMAMSRLAGVMGDAGLASQAATYHDHARASLRSRYRDTREQRWISGFTHAGKAGESTSPADLAAIGSGAATAEEAAITLDQLAAPAYVTAWGLRSRPSTARDYDPETYSRGSVWGLGTASAAETLWKAGRSEQANTLWRSLVPWAGVDAPGHMHEVMRGDAFTPQRESVPEQMWSSAAFLSAAITGLMGLDVDSAQRTLRFAPRPPANWNELRVRNVRVGDQRLDLYWQRLGDGTQLTIDNRGPAIRLQWVEPATAGRPAQQKERDVLQGRSVLRWP